MRKRTDQVISEFKQRNPYDSIDNYLIGFTEKILKINNAFDIETRVNKPKESIFKNPRYLLCFALGCAVTLLLTFLK